MSRAARPIHVSLVAIADSLAFPVTSIYETFQILESLGAGGSKLPSFEVEIVGQARGAVTSPTGLELTAQRSFAEIDDTDIVIMTSMVAGDNNEWETGRHPDAVDWLRARHRGGATLCSSCTGALLMAETGLLEGLDATIHWAYAPTFRTNFPEVRLQLKEVLVSGGERQEFVMAGATSSWQDLVLYLVTRFSGAHAARALGKFMLFQWHSDTMAPYVTFVPPTDHGDVIIRDAQEWLAANSSKRDLLMTVQTRSGLPKTTFKRRFKRATGYSPLPYVQQLRVEEAKRQLEATEATVDEISWRVGYDNSAFFRRIFKRTTRLTPGEYRRKFRTPEFARFP